MNRVCTVQARSVEKIINFAATYGVRAESLYKAVNLDPSRISNPDQQIPFVQLVSLYEQAAALTGDDAFGLHLGENIDPKVFDVLGYAAMNSPTLGEAIDRVARYHSIWTDGAAIDLETTKTTSKITYRYLDHSLGKCRQDAELTFAAFAALGRLVTNREWRAIEVKFQHDAPRDTSEHVRIFGALVSFGKQINELVFDSATLELPIVKADPGLCAVLDRHAEELLARYPRQDVMIDRVRTILKNELNGGDPSLERVAEQLGMSRRTLQRKLRDHDCSHHELLDQMRRDLAMRYLQEPEMAICEVAYLLGFSESSALHRAFKRWTGMTPSAFRRQYADELQLSSPRLKV
ncbi:MAG TPA: AraC family transcriptional regulator [Pyrinomonadaceae bacterium]|nr:AraC family transcriptional regulator [Pyrinomonadaceae bacterium]